MSQQDLDWKATSSESVSVEDQQSQVLASLRVVNEQYCLSIVENI